MARQLAVAGVNGGGDALVGPVHLGLDLVAGLRSESLDLVQPAEADQHQSHQLQNPVVRGDGDGGMQIVHGFDELDVGRALLSDERVTHHPRARGVDTLRRQVGDGHFDTGAQLGQIGERHASARQVDRGRFGHGVRRSVP